MKCMRCVVKLLLIIGALNWGLIGFFQYDLIGMIFGGQNMMGARVVFSIVGLAGVFALCCLFKNCSGGSCGPSCGCGCCKK